MKELFEAHPESLQAVDQNGLTPVVVASSVGRCDLTTIFELLRNGPDLAR